MIKRRFYKQEHGDKDNDNAYSSSSSSDSDSDADAQGTEEEHESNAVPQTEPDDNRAHRSASSGYESDDSSANEVDGDLSDDNEAQPEIYIPSMTDSPLRGKDRSELLETRSSIMANEDSLPEDAADCILKCKSVFKCKLCPKVVCLTEETLITHLKSKRHARSEKLLKEGRLKRMLNSDGESEEEDGETHGERHARFAALVQGEGKKKKNKGRQRQKERLRKKKLENKLNKGDVGNVMQSTEKPARKRRKSEK